MSLVCVTVLMATGIVNGFALGGRIRALYTTEYGCLLLAKVGLFLLVVGIGAVNRLALRGAGAGGLGVTGWRRSGGCGSCGLMWCWSWYLRG